ncbi:DUF1656 domain-containing protein [Croceicoccus mobilis]|uniref:DUF1656 domain-containing protein n=1 Tax=Croceicoccus mobilis TaxID=1703339 RepID=A0A917DXN3_9SPHN|nr:DUF1656 domain-containing protein [Croceicoccus mobilis]GGD78650.1 hypothetical protein GCM10010990_30650 [Croceicoccus mobilis]
MTGEVSIGGVFVPTLLLLAILAMVIAALVIRLLSLVGGYRYLAYKALVDLAIFVLVFGGLFFLSIKFGFHP